MVRTASGAVLFAGLVAACSSSSGPPGGGAGFDSGDIDATFGEEGGTDAATGGDTAIEASVGVDSSAAPDAGPDGTAPSDAALDGPASSPEAGVEGGTEAGLIGFGAAVAVTMGQAEGCALTSGGGAVCWGPNGYGQLGDNSTALSLVPVQVTGLTSGVTSIGVGESSACAVTAGGAVQCWGWNMYGELGNGSTAMQSLVPVQVTGLTSGVKAVAMGFYTACAITAGGGAVCWGVNGDGQLGNGSTFQSGVPVQVTGLTSGVTSIAIGEFAACAVTAGGGVMCWGYNEDGVLGSDAGQSLVPQQVTGLTSGVAAVSVGNEFACALTNAGGVVCWGNNSTGQLGNGTTISSDVPVQVTGLTSGVTSLSAGHDSACAVTAGGGVSCWGYNLYGQLGNGTNANSSVPVQVTGLTSGVSAVSVFDGACAVVGCGLKCWGYDTDGELGNGSTNNVSTPVSASLLGANPCL